MHNPEDILRNPRDAHRDWSDVTSRIKQAGKVEILVDLDQKPYAVLDLGCGRGFMVDYLRRRFSLKAYGVDRMLCSEKRSWFFECSADVNMPFPDESFPIVYSQALFDAGLYGNWRKEIFEGARRVLKPGGVFVIGDYDQPPFKDAEGFRVLLERGDFGYISVLEKTE